MSNPCFLHAAFRGERATERVSRAERRAGTRITNSRWGTNEELQAGSASMSSESGGLSSPSFLSIAAAAATWGIREKPHHI